MKVNLSSFEQSLYLSIVSIISFTLYQLFMLFTVVSFKETCLYSIWLPYEDMYFSPYWAVVFTVSCLIIWACMLLIITFIEGTTNFWNIALCIFTLSVLLYWLYSLWYFWQFMQIEKGLLEPAEFFNDERSDVYFYVKEYGYELCKGT